MKHKLSTWIKRYLPAEIIGTITALLGAMVVYTFTQNNILAAFAGTWGENIGYYGTIITRDIRKNIHSHKKKKKSYSFFSLLITIRDIIFEFGPAEILDSLFIRPFMMYIFPLVTGNLALGIFLGKLAADCVFYIPTIIMYEIKIYKKNKDKKPM